jgi:hypothetical protein
MTVSEMIVCDSGGVVTGELGEIKMVSADDPFAFYAGGSITTEANGNQMVNDVKRVKIVMPLGGNESGLFRQPRVGEKVLVGVESDEHYLMGYLPTKDGDNPFTAIDKDKKAEVFRYKQTGKKSDKAGTEQYSEIGFYHQKTAWKASDTDRTNYATLVDDKPKIDRIKIHSTGDLHQSAENYQKTTAKRFELLVDCEKDGQDPGEYATKHPLGDRSGDDSNLYRGDAHFRAKNRIVIKAGQEIRLQVGRSTVIISDDGVTISARKTHANLMTGWDSTLSLTARSGLAMFGQHVKIEAGYDFSISEAWGGSLKSIGGVLRLAGKDIKALAFCPKAYLMNTLSASAQVIEAVATMGAGIGEADQKIGFVNKLPAYIGQITGIAPLLINSAAGWSGAQTSVADPIGTMATYMGLIQKILQAIVYTVIDMMITQKSKDNSGRDGFNLAAMVVEYGLMIPLYSAVFIKSVFKPLHASYLHLTNDATAVLGGFKTKILHTASDEAAGPVIGIDSPPVEEESSWTRGEKIVTGIALGLPAAAIGGVVAWQMIEHILSVNDQSTDTLKELQNI